MIMSKFINQTHPILNIFFIFSIGVTVHICCKGHFQEEDQWKSDDK